MSINRMGRAAGKITATMLAVAALFVSAPGAAKSPLTLTDISGRQVTVQVPVTKMILGEGRFLPTLAILERDNPIDLVAAMMGEFERFDPATFAQWAERFPAIRNIPKLGASGAESFSTESAITAKPDVALFGLGGHGPSARHKEILDNLAAAGIPVVVVDFRADPIINTPKSLRILGKLLGREKEAQEFLDFYAEELGKVRAGLQGSETKPSVFMELRVGLREECCDASGNTMLGRFISEAGGENVFGDVIPGTHGRVDVEHLITRQPDIYIGTAIGASVLAKKFPSYIALGVGTPADQARATLTSALGRIGVAQLDAVKQGRAYTIWHHFYNTPMHVALVQAMAKWFHPDRFRDLKPDRTLAEYFRRFQPVTLKGVYWAGVSDP